MRALLLAGCLVTACGGSGAGRPVSASPHLPAPVKAPVELAQGQSSNAAPESDECRTSADCKAPARCCSNGFQPVNRCTTSCDDHEACSPESRANTCHAATSCVRNVDSHSGGVCRVAEPSVRCGDRRCTGDEPACYWPRATRRGECVAVGPEGGWTEELANRMSGTEMFLECASPADCAGERCCTNGPMPMTSCAGTCASGIDVCDTISDCPTFLGPATGCAADADGPPFLKTCRYDAPP